MKEYADHWELTPDTELWDIVLAYTYALMKAINKERRPESDGEREDPFECIERLRKTRWPQLPKVAEISVHLGFGAIEAILGMYETPQQAYQEMQFAAARVFERGKDAHEANLEKRKAQRNAAKRAFFDELRAKREGARKTHA